MVIALSRITDLCWSDILIVEMSIGNNQNSRRMLISCVIRWMCDWFSVSSNVQC